MLDIYPMFTFTYFKTSILEILEWLKVSFEEDELNWKITKINKHVIPDILDNWKRGKKDSKSGYKALFFENDKGCFMVSNLVDGWHTLAYSTACHFKTFCIQLCFDSLVGEDTYNGFTAWDKGEEKRVVYAMKDPGWKFYEKGEILWFENSEFYKRRFIKDRMNSEILVSYCNCLNIKLEIPEFWDSVHSYLLEYC